ncbi:transposase [Thermogutta sp.]|uniref:transposase n=1 Tax=Thermogutta sp. TaxID=1962930 RepID=UPI0025F2D75B|nr:transposase [Thermogutta sp.]
MMRPFEEKVALLCEITGVDKKTVQAIIAEIGVNMSRFPTDKHIASWAGVCPRTTRARARGNRADSERGARG